MNRLRWLAVAIGLLLSANGCRTASDREKALSAGAATVFDETRNAFSFPIQRLTEKQRRSFFVGNSFFNDNWIAAPASPASRDGLGPLFNQRSCSGCHFKDGRGRPPDPGQGMSSMLLRVSVPGRDAHGGPLPDPVYGGQIQGDALPGVPAEARVVVEYEVLPGRFADGESYELRKPRYLLHETAYGTPSSALLSSPRVAPAIIGLGLLEAVAESDLRARADPEDRDGDGISGRVNEVWDVERRAVTLGRFGWKAEQPSVLQQCAAAFLGDMGITSRLFPGENCAPGQSVCAAQPSGGAPELSDQILTDVALYARSLAVPARRRVHESRVVQGEKLFGRAGCGACHSPTLRAGVEPFVGTFHAYTDLLLHDLGEGLSDRRPAYGADGSEWRTAPLWGMGLLKKVNDHTFLLHDGRARDAQEAILWHGGEAASAQAAFRRMNRDERQALLAFLDSL